MSTRFQNVIVLMMMGFKLDDDWRLAHRRDV